MRLVVGLLMYLSLDGLSQAQAPANQPAAAPPGNPAPAGPQSAKAPELTPEEKNLLAHGYQLETRNGANYFCRSQTTLGTRFQKKVCATAAQLGNLRQDSKDAAARAQQPGWQPTGH